MSRIAMSCTDRAKREVLPLELALYHAVRDYPGGAAAISATTFSSSLAIAGLFCIEEMLQPAQRVFSRLPADEHLVWIYL